MEDGIERISGESSPATYDWIARIHAAEIHHGVLPLLGQRFLTSLYRAIADAPGSGVWVVRREGRVVGFLAGTASTRSMYRDILRRRGAKLAWHALPRIPRILRKVLGAATYPRKAGHEAELLAIASVARGQGVGRMLVDVFETALIQDGVHRYAVSTNEAEPESNAFYQKLGFQLSGKQRHHELTLNMYEKTIMP